MGMVSEDFFFLVHVTIIVFHGEPLPLHHLSLAVPGLLEETQPFSGLSTSPCAPATSPSLPLPTKAPSLVWSPLPSLSFPALPSRHAHRPLHSSLLPPSFPPHPPTSPPFTRDCLAASKERPTKHACRTNLARFPYQRTKTTTTPIDTVIPPLRSRFRRFLGGFFSLLFCNSTANRKVQAQRQQTQTSIETNVPVPVVSRRLGQTRPTRRNTFL